MLPIPADTSFDSTLDLLRDPYRFISRKCHDKGLKLFQTRILLRKTICMTGQEAAIFFYNEKNFVRKGGMPEPIVATLLGKGGVQSLDGDAHKHRKRMFMSFMTPDSIQRLVKITEKYWLQALPEWEKRQQVVLYEALLPILTQGVCEWAGIPLAEEDVPRRTEQLRAMFDDAGSAGLRHFHSRRMRKKAESWIKDVIHRARAGTVLLQDPSPARTVCWHRDLDGTLLSEKVAAVELLNLLRPTVAVAVFLVFTAHALYRHSEYRAKLEIDRHKFPTFFVQEVRRFYPFFPAVAAKVRDNVEWNGYIFPKGSRVMLDLYGINHDPEIWYEPDQFIPERFQVWNGSPYNFVPQGGGDHFVHHRCPGERITIELMKMAVHFLTENISYTVPGQDLLLQQNRLPALPKSRFVISNIGIKARTSTPTLQI